MSSSSGSERERHQRERPSGRGRSSGRDEQQPQVQRRDEQQGGVRVEQPHDERTPASSTSSIARPAASGSGRTLQPEPPHEHRPQQPGEHEARARRRARPPRRSRRTAARSAAPAPRGAAARMPERAQQVANSAQAKNGSAQPSVHRSSARPARRGGAGARGRRRRRTAARAAASATSSRSAHAGSVLRCRSTPVCGVEETSGAASSASTALSTARPKPSRRSRLTALARGRAAFARDLHEHGRDAGGVQRALLADGQRERQMGELAERARARRVRTRSRWVIASASVRCSCSGAEPKPSEKGTTNGLRSCAPARSPSTIAASSGPRGRRRRSPPRRRRRRCRRWSRRARSCAGLARGEHARQLEQRGRAGQLGPRAARGRVAVGEDHDRRRVRSSPAAARSPWSACARRRSSAPRSWRVCTEKPPPAVPPSPSSVAGDLRGERLIAALPGRRSGNARGQAASVPPSARAPSNASGASVELSGRGRLVSENAAIASANTKGTKAAR